MKFLNTSEQENQEQENKKLEKKTNIPIEESYCHTYHKILEELLN